MFGIAADELRAVKAAANKLDADRREIVDPLNKVVKTINDRYRPAGEFLAEAEKIIKAAMLGYQNEQDRIAAEAKRKAEEAAAEERRRLAEEARLREAKAEAERQAIAKAEADRAAAAKAERERIQREADEAKAKGDAEAARRADEAAAAARVADEAAAAIAAQQQAQVTQAAALDVAAIEQISAVIVAAPPPVMAKTAGISTAKGWDFRVVDKLALIRYVAEHPEFVDVLIEDSVRLRGLVKGLGKSLPLAGVEVFSKSTLRAA
jgi:hypothetical protein